MTVNASVERSNDVLILDGSTTINLRISGTNQWQVAGTVWQPIADNSEALGAGSLRPSIVRSMDLYAYDDFDVDDDAIIDGDLSVSGNTTIGNAKSDTLTLTADIANEATIEGTAPQFHLADTTAGASDYLIKVDGNKVYHQELRGYRCCLCNF